MKERSIGITVLAHKKFQKLRFEASFQLAKVSADGYKIWCRLDRAVCETMERHGKKVGWDDDDDFFRSGDWFHEYTIGFGIQTTVGLSLKLLRDIKKVAAKHSKKSMVTMGGSHDDLDGLDILVISSGIYVAWDKCDARACKRRLKMAKVNLE